MLCGARLVGPTVAGLYSIEIRVTATPADFLGGEVVQVAGAASLVGGRLHPSVVLPAPLDAGVIGLDVAATFDSTHCICDCLGVCGAGDCDDSPSSFAKNVNAIK